MDKEETTLKIIIADVTFTITDETYYVSPKESRYTTKYLSETLEDTMKLLREDKWTYSGKVGKWDYSLVDMWSKGDELIAIWEE